MAEVDERTKAAKKRELDREARLKELADERAKKLREMAEARAAAKPSPASVRAADERTTAPAPTPAPTPAPAPVAASPASVRAADERTTPSPAPVVSAAESPTLTNAVAAANKFTTSAVTATTREERMDELKYFREAASVSKANERAASDPMLDFKNRPAAPAPDDNYIYYYSWIGGVTSGEWKLYRAPNTPDNAAKYLSRSIGGETQATGGSAVGANALKNQPKVSPSGTIVSVGAGNTTATTTPSTTTPSTTTPSTTTPSTTTPSTTTPSTTTVAKPVGTPPAFVYDSVSDTWVRPPYPTDGIQYTWDDSAGWVNVNVKPGPTGTSLTDTGRNLAVNTFKNTLALLFGPLEANQPWMDELYSLVSSYYKTGSTIEEATNLSLRDARNNPKLTKFTNRFKAIFALEDMVRAGRPVYVPTIAEYVGTEEKLGDVFSRAGLGDLANQEILSQVIGTGKSVTETTAIITDAFALVDNAPDAWKAAINKQFPYATRNQLAKALLLGEKGAQALEKEFQTIGVQAAAEQQGLTINQARAQDIFSQGYGYTQALGKFGEVARILPRAQQLSAFSKEEPLTQLDVEQARIEKLASKQRKLEELEQRELARFSGQSGVGKTSLTKQRYI